MQVLRLGAMQEVPSLAPNVCIILPLLFLRFAAEGDLWL